jgi:hypothetical protein
VTINGNIWETRYSIFYRKEVWILNTENLTGTQKRKEMKYQRRKAKRMEKKQQKLEKFNDVTLVADADVLYESFQKCKKGTIWKKSVQKVDYDLLYVVTELKEKVLNKETICEGFYSFPLIERGKLRRINATRINERIVQKALNDNVLVPLFMDYIIYDNVASVKNAGTKRAEERLLMKLREYYRKHGNFNGYIVMFDVHHFFESINRDELIEYVTSYILNDILRWLYIEFIQAFNQVFPDNKGLGLGSQVSQHGGLVYVNPIDHYIKDQLGIHDYERYMDDSSVIVETYEEAEAIIGLVQKAYEKKGLQLNNKTKICRLDKPFRFLKKRYICTSTGKIYRNIWRKNIINERKRLREFKYLLDNGKLTPKDVFDRSLSWSKGNAQYDCHYEIRDLRKYYVGLELPVKRIKTKYLKGKVINRNIEYIYPGNKNIS